MNPKVAVFYHCLFSLPDQLLPSACIVVNDQMQKFKACGLHDRADEIVVGVNGGAESVTMAAQMIPPKANIVYHGLKSRSENLTLVELEKWLPTHEDWLVLYFHAKGATHATGSDYGKFCDRWRNCMMLHCVHQWEECLKDLESVESVGCHWMTGLGEDKSQNIWAGNFWWCRASYLRTLPSIFERDRIKVSGIESLESRYESEVWIGNGKRLPTVKDLAGHTVGQCP